jgi:hypothetical protein
VSSLSESSGCDLTGSVWKRGVTVASLDILFLSKEDVDALDLGLDEVMDAVELGLRAHGENKVIMPAKARELARVRQLRGNRYVTLRRGRGVRPRMQAAGPACSRHA